MTWARVAAAWLASLGSRRAATADRPCASACSALGSVVLLMAWARVAAAGPHTAAASLGSIRAATADRPCANAHRALGFVSLLMAWARVAAAWPPSLGSRWAATADRPEAKC